ncbi:histone family protein [Methanopyrus sp.]
MDPDLPTNVLEEILKKSARSADGVLGVRMSAKKEYYRVIESLSIALAKLSVLAARHASRKTVKAEDVELAAATLDVISSIRDHRGRGGPRG